MSLQLIFTEHTWGIKFECQKHLIYITIKYNFEIN